jgi:hypothetical protein
VRISPRQRNEPLQCWPPRTHPSSGDTKVTDDTENVPAGSGVTLRDGAGGFPEVGLAFEVGVVLAFEVGFALEVIPAGVGEHAASSHPAFRTANPSATDRAAVVGTNSAS